SRIGTVFSTPLTVRAPMVGGRTTHPHPADPAGVWCTPAGTGRYRLPGRRPRQLGWARRWRRRRRPGRRPAAANRQVTPARAVRGGGRCAPAGPGRYRLAAGRPRRLGWARRWRRRGRPGGRPGEANRQVTPARAVRPRGRCARPGRLRLLRGRGCEADHPVVVGPPPVDHARAAGLLVEEQVEVVSQQLHLEQRVLDRHRLTGVLLLTDDAPGPVLFFLLFRHLHTGHLAGLGQLTGLGLPGFRGGRGRGHGRPDTALQPSAPLRGAAQPAVQLRDRLVERRGELAGTCLRPDHGSAREAGDLHALAVVRLTGVGLVPQLDLDPDDLLVVPVSLGELLLDLPPEVVGHLEVAALDDDVHADLPLWSSCALAPERPRPVAATTSTPGHPLPAEPGARRGGPCLPP